MIQRTDTGEWITLEAKWMKEKWENDRAVMEFLKKVSMGDCRGWLQDFMVRWKEILKTMGK